MKKKTGRLYVVGVGPGDPELLTVKAVRILRSVPCLCVPKGREEGSSLALSIVRQAVDLEGKDIIEAHFPMRKTKRHDPEMDAKWQETVEAVSGILKGGREIAFITIGDPSIYSTFFYLYDRLLEIHPGLDVIFVPGVSSINASAAAAKISLGLADEKIAVLPANYTADRIVRTLQDFDTVVLMKVHKIFHEAVKALESIGLLDNATYVSRAGMEDERVFRDVRDVKDEDLNYFSLMIIRRH